MFERFSGDAQDAISRAQGSARRLHCGYVGTEHLLLGLLEQTDTLTGRLLVAHGLDWASAEAATVRLLGAAGCRPDTGDPRRGADGREADGRHADALDDALDADALEAIGIDLSAVRDRVEAAFGAGALDREPARRRGRSATRGAVPFSRRARKSVELSLRESLRLRHVHRRRAPPARSSVRGPGARGAGPRRRGRRPAGAAQRAGGDDPHPAGALTRTGSAEAPRLPGDAELLAAPGSRPRPCGEDRPVVRRLAPAACQVEVELQPRCGPAQPPLRTCATPFADLRNGRFEDSCSGGGRVGRWARQAWVRQA